MNNESQRKGLINSAYGVLLTFNNITKLAFVLPETDYGILVDRDFLYSFVQTRM